MSELIDTPGGLWSELLHTAARLRSFGSINSNYAADPVKIMDGVAGELDRVAELFEARMTARNLDVARVFREAAGALYRAAENIEIMAEIEAEEAAVAAPRKEGADEL
jgi:hypothetical protein